MDRRVGPDHFREPLARHGEEAFTVAVGGISVRFEGLSRELAEAALERYRPFLSDLAPLDTVQICAGEPDYLDMARDGYMRAEEHSFPEGRLFTSHDFAALRPPDSGPATLRIAPSIALRKRVGALENYMRWRVADLALDRSGFVMHGAGLVREGRAYIFFGHSGAGKSTVTELSMKALGAVPLSDDLVLVFRESGVFRAVTTPFWGSMPQTVKELGIYPLSAIYNLVQSDRVESAPMPLALATAKVLSCCPFVADPARRTTALVSLVEGLCRSVPVRTLHFRKDASFWDEVTRQENSHASA